jgi:hypothetical protein
MRSRGYLEMAWLGTSSWMPYAPQGLKGIDDNDDDEDDDDDDTFIVEFVHRLMSSWCDRLTVRIVR